MYLKNVEGQSWQWCTWELSCLCTTVISRARPIHRLANEIGRCEPFRDAGICVNVCRKDRLFLSLLTSPPYPLFTIFLSRITAGTTGGIFWDLESLEAIKIPMASMDILVNLHTYFKIFRFHNKFQAPQKITLRLVDLTLQQDVSLPSACFLFVPICKILNLNSDGLCRGNDIYLSHHE